jgi:hypothetical protein
MKDINFFGSVFDLLEDSFLQLGAGKYSDVACV